MLQQDNLDKILYIQLTIARLGEKELMSWWNTDVVYKLGGADFLQRLVGEIIAPLAAGEASVTGNDFPIPLTIQITEPNTKPDFSEPDYQVSWSNQKED